ncbi:MAG TPA: sigma-54 dependent transcriptional regulator [Bryobacteraceae bacterium]
MNTILIAEDEPEVRDYLGVALNCEGYDVEFAQNGEEVVSLLERDGARVSLLLLDLIMPHKDGFETLREVRQTWPALPVITLSGSCTPANVATVLKAGALDFLSKPIGHDDLLRVIEGVLKTPNGNKKTPTEGKDTACVLSAGTWSQRVNALLERVGGSDVPVLLRGETGVGKEVLARRLHEQSKRASRPFLKLNCAALPSELVESELFGYERGAFTGALKNTPGKFEMANGGTILLDEIGDMDFKLQAKLLQVLQDKEFLRLGAKDTCRVDVRVMAATHCNLEEAIEAGRFREDLYYRLNIVEVHVPPLRERKDEILTLSEFFLQKYAPNETPEISSPLQQALIEHDWPGNVRELENVIRKFLVFRSVEMIAADLKQKARPSAGKIFRSAAPLPDSANGSSPRSLTPADPDDAPLAPDHPAYASPAAAHQPSNGVSEEPAVQTSVLAQVDLARKRAEVDVILSALHSTLWNRKQAAKLLNIDYKALLYKMKKLGIGEKMPNGAPAVSRNSN